MDRDDLGHFQPGNTVGPRFGRDIPPPSGGRPKRDAWVRDLERELAGVGVRASLAQRVLAIALKGKDADALAALKLIQDRIGGPIALRVDGVSEEYLRGKIYGLLAALKEIVPPEKLHCLAELAREHLVDEE